jgi:hypothetical protein
MPGIRAVMPGIRAVMPGIRAVMPGIRAVMPGIRAVMPDIRAVMPGIRAVMPGIRAVMPGICAVIPAHPSNFEFIPRAGAKPCFGLHSAILQRLGWTQTCTKSCNTATALILLVVRVFTLSM